MRTRLTALPLVALGALPVAAQTRRPCPLATAEPYLVCQVDTPPQPASTNAIPPYPVMLRQGKAPGGSVRFTMVIDSAGRPDPASFVVVESSHPLWTMATKAAASTWRFRPGLEVGRPVAVRWEQVVAFAALPEDAPPQADTEAARDTSVDGTPRLVVGAGAPQANAIITFSVAELLDAQRAVLRHLAPKPVSDSAGRARVTVCVTVSRGSQEDAADSATIAALAAPGRNATIPRDCPATYEGMIWSSERRPRGYIDPYYMTVARLVAWNASVLVMRVEIGQSGSARIHRCWATRGVPTWQVQCRPEMMSIS